MNQTVKENTRKAEDSLNQAQASLQSIAAQRAVYEQSLSDCTVTAPISGIVQECNVTEGAILSGGTPFVLVNLDTVKVVLNISESMVSKVNTGDKVEISVPSYSEDKFTGEISTVAPGANADGTYDVTIEVDNADGVLKAGMFAQADFVKNSSDQCIVLDRNAVVSDSQGDYVFSVNEDSTVSKLPVVTGIDTGEKIEIINGVDENMTIVTSGNTYLSEGDQVHIVTEENDASADSFDEKDETTPQDDKKEESIDVDETFN
ncbi:MAG: efflux RND transporter periplasmic adaptor subunit [Clostridiales bacterium]|nr:efflux RND transporter periplasmic adaptor subunit [Clostridiales bacterium]